MCKIGQQEIWGSSLHACVTSSLGSPQEADLRVSACGAMPLWTATGRQGHNTTSSWATYYSPSLSHPLLTYHSQHHQAITYSWSCGLVECVFVRDGWVGAYQCGDTLWWLWQWCGSWESAVGDGRGVSLQVAVTFVIASYFPLQRKIVFIMCHAHSARQGPLESIPKSQREEALHLNSRLASNKKGEKEQREEVEEEEDRREGRGVEKTEEAHH